METERLLENSRKKLKKKNLDMVAANSLNEAGAGFGGSTNVLTLITADSEEQLPLLSKEEAAHRCWMGFWRGGRNEGRGCRKTAS